MLIPARSPALTNFSTALVRTDCSIVPPQIESAIPATTTLAPHFTNRDATLKHEAFPNVVNIDHILCKAKNEAAGQKAQKFPFPALAG
jgi:hypothetical protein